MAKHVASSTRNSRVNRISITNAWSVRSTRSIVKEHVIELSIVVRGGGSKKYEAINLQVVDGSYLPGVTTGKLGIDGLTSPVSADLSSSSAQLRTEPLCRLRGKSIRRYIFNIL
jgi:hypothetical protein